MTTSVVWQRKFAKVLNLINAGQIASVSEGNQVELNCLGRSKNVFTNSPKIQVVVTLDELVQVDIEGL